ncbi:MAG TPA: hypothetical protein VJ323_07215 [Bryobacteraceae bacterium]|nr:hypothetical protein [Bryobacteraceae bacterium]
MSAPCVNYLEPSAFALPAAGTHGTLGKGVFRGPNLITYNGGLFKDIPVRGERYRIQFRAEFFNLLNRVNLNDPGTTIANAGFGSIKAAGDPRIGQLALKFLF